MSVIRHVVIHGRVQAVGFRAWTEFTARGRGLQGWVRNRRDGSVEAVFAGSREAVEAMVADCRRGPPGARVDAIENREATLDELAMRHGIDFAVLPTG
jgi:acylphosphatase